MFQCLQDVVASASVNTRKLFAIIISQHLKELATSLGQYFSENADPRKGNFWIVNPSAKDIGTRNLNTLRKNR